MTKLVHLDQFRLILNNYTPSQQSLELLNMTKLVLFVGVTASGRNTIINKLLTTAEYHHLLSDTTREIRTKNGIPIEESGDEYWFRKEEDVLKDLQKGEFLEAAVVHEQQVSGISTREIERAEQSGLISITDVERVG